MEQGSSRPRELHPEPLTGPDVSLSTHPARATNLKATAFHPNMRAHPVPVGPIRMLVTHPLRSTIITIASSLLRGSPPLIDVSVLSA
jgi:hypothetical protein